MLDLVERADQFGQLVIGQRQRIAAGQNHFLDAAISRYFGQRRRPVIAGGELLRVREMTTKTVAAMHRAGAGRDQQHAALVFVDQSGLADLAEIADRIDDVAGARITFAQRRPDLQRSEEHTSELQSLMRISYAAFCLKKK